MLEEISVLILYTEDSEGSAKTADRFFKKGRGFQQTSKKSTGPDVQLA